MAKSKSWQQCLGAIALGASTESPVINRELYERLVSGTPKPGESLSSAIAAWLVDLYVCEQEYPTAVPPPALLADNVLSWCPATIALPQALTTHTITLESLKEGVTSLARS